jgi:hypothetical protein
MACLARFSFSTMFLAKADKLKDEKEKAKLTAKVKEQLKGM